MSSNERQLEKYHRVRMELIEYMGSKCVTCNQTENLEFDHINSETKSFNIAQNWSRNREVLLQELEKCQLLCFSCHKTKTTREGTPSHGGWGMFKRGCRCAWCVGFVNEYQAEYKRKKRLHNKYYGR